MDQHLLKGDNCKIRHSNDKNFIETDYLNIFVEKKWKA